MRNGERSVGWIRQGGVVVRAFVFCCAVAIPAAAWAVPADPSQDLIALVQRFTEAQRAFSPATLKELTTDDYVEVSPVGDVDTREKMLGFYAPENRTEVPVAKVTETDVRWFGDAAVVIAKLSFEFMGPDQVSHVSEMRATFVARRTASGWKLVSTHYTGIRASQGRQAH